jgi:hypothetical protein
MSVHIFRTPGRIALAPMWLVVSVVLAVMLFQGS